MHGIISRGLMGVLFTGGLMALGVGVAHADELSGTTNGEDSILGGTQALVSADLPVNLRGTALSIIGDSTSTGSLSDSSDSGALASNTSETNSSAPTSAPTTSGSHSLLGGTQGLVDLAVPVTVSGNAISVLGDSSSSGTTTGAPATSGTGGGPTTDGDDSVAGGSQVITGVDVPVTVSGNAISVIGDSTTSDSSTAGPGTGEGDAASTGSPTTNGTDSAIGGTQVVAPIGAPVIVGGNAMSVLGDSTSTSSTATGSTAGSTGGTSSPVTSGDESILGGTQIALPVTAPITIGGNAVSVLGDATTGTRVRQVPPVSPTVRVIPTVDVRGSESTGGITTAALGVHSLASTGVEAAAWGALVALLLSAGVMLIGASNLRRRRS